MESYLAKYLKGFHCRQPFASASNTACQISSGVRLSTGSGSGTVPARPAMVARLYAWCDTSRAKNNTSAHAHSATSYGVRPYAPATSDTISQPSARESYPGSHW